MIFPKIDFNGYKISAMGFGCARFGSMSGSSGEEAKNLVTMALDNGITFFDTASSYGQGDSERILGQIIGKNENIFIATKIGKRVPFKAKLLQPIKNIIRKYGRMSGNAANIIKQSRPGKLPVCFDIPFLEKELMKSRLRLSIDCIPMVMLHSPPTSVLIKGDAVSFLDNSRKKGLLNTIGVAVDDLDAAEATLKDDRIQAVQVPFLENDLAMEDWAVRAKMAGKLVIAREIFSEIKGLNEKNAKEHIRRNIHRVLSNQSVGVSLLGTTKPKHLLEVIELAKA